MEKKKSGIKVQVEPALVGPCQPRQATFTLLQHSDGQVKPRAARFRYCLQIIRGRFSQSHACLWPGSGCISLPASSHYKTPNFFAESLCGHPGNMKQTRLALKPPRTPGWLRHCCARIRSEPRFNVAQRTVRMLAIAVTHPCSAFRVVAFTTRGSPRR